MRVGFMAANISAYGVFYWISPSPVILRYCSSADKVSLDPLLNSSLLDHSRVSLMNAVSMATLKHTHTHNLITLRIPMKSTFTVSGYGNVAS